MKRLLAVFVFAALAAASATAQKMYVADYTGPALLVRANGDLVGPAGTREKLKLWTPVAYGDVIVTGSGGRITLSLPGTLSVSIPESSVIGYFFAGPGTEPRPFISLIAGDAGISKPAGISRGLEVHDDRVRAAANSVDDQAQLLQLDHCAAKLETLYEELKKLDADCANSTTKLETANDKYRTLLAATGGTISTNGTDTVTMYRKADLQNFRETQLYPAEDERSSLIRAIQYRTILARTIRNLILSPLYMTVKSARPQPESRDAETVAFLEKYATVIGRYEENSFRYNFTKSSGDTGLP